MVSVQKWPFFQLFLLRQYTPGKVFYDILERKHAFLGYKNKKFKKSKNWHFSKRVNPRFWLKNGHFSNFFFRQNVRHKNVFYDTLKQKNAFLGNKNTKFKNSNNEKWPFLQLIFYAIQARKKSFTIFSTKKNAFLGYKNKKFKKSKNWLFFKGVNPWFWSKNDHFSKLFF